MVSCVHSNARDRVWSAWTLLDLRSGRSFELFPECVASTMLVTRNIAEYLEVCFFEQIFHINTGRCVV